MAQLSPSPKLYFVDNNGNPLVGGKLYTYASGTTTPQATFTTSAATTPNTNPIILNSRGECEAWLDNTKQYTFALFTSTDVPVWTVDNINGNSTSAPVNVLDFGAVADATSGTTGTDNAAAFQAAFNTGHAVFIPAASVPGYGYRLTTANIVFPVNVYGEGITATTIFPTTGYSTFVVANDSVQITDMQFIGKTGTGQAEVYGDCIRIDAVTHDAGFTGFEEGVKIQRVKFRNLKMNAILVAQLLRESHIRECRFVGMGNAGTSRSPIKMQQTLGGSGNNQNILWIDKNMFYRLDTPAINLKRSTLISPLYSDSSYDGIMITGNLIHGQLQNENGVEPVQPYPAHQVVIEDGTRTIIQGNIFTAIHPLYDAVHVECGGTVCKSIDVSHNTMSVKQVVGGVTYSRTGGGGTTLATGHYVSVTGVESMSIRDNSVNAGIYQYDFLVNNGDYASTIDVRVQDNVTEGDVVLVDSSGLGTFTGIIESNSVTTSTNSGLFFGSVDTGICKPSTDNTYSLGTAGRRWTQVFAVNGTINTSDERSKTQIRPIDEAALRAWGKVNFVQYKFKDALEIKGDNARWHFGVIAQHVKSAFESEGLDPFDYGVLCHDTWDEHTEPSFEMVDGRLTHMGLVTVLAGDRYGIRYDEALALECAYLRSKIH